MLMKVTPQNFSMYLARAAAGDVVAVNQVAICYEKGKGGQQRDLAEAATWFQRAAALGRADAHAKEGRCHWFGEPGKLPQRLDLAFNCFLAGSTKNDPMAWLWLGHCHESGKGVSHIDHALAFACFKNAVDQGFSDAFKRLAHCYEQGLGVTCDLDLAIAYYDKAVKAKDRDAESMLKLARLYLRKQKVAAETALAMAYLVKLERNAGDRYPKTIAAEAAYTLGVCNEQGFGTPVNLQNAQYWYEKAAPYISDAWKGLVALLAPTVDEQKQVLGYSLFLAGKKFFRREKLIPAEHLSHKSVLFGDHVYTAAFAGEKIALKTFSGEDALSKWAHEVAIYQHLGPSPFLVAYRGATVIEAESVVQYAFMMDLLPMTLATALASSSVLSLNIRLQIAIDLLSALQHIHQKQVTHGDIKTRNVLLTADYRAKLTDFGLACTDVERQYVSSRGLGTARWMPPELRVATKKPVYYTFACDVYSMGLMLYDIFAASTEAHSDFSLLEVEAKHLSDYKPVSPTGVDIKARLKLPDCSEDEFDKVANLILDCTRYDPLVRPTAEAVFLRCTQIQATFFARSALKNAKATPPVLSVPSMDCNFSS